MKRNSRILAACLLAALAIGGCQVGLPADVAKLGYVNRDEKFAMDVPPGWTLREQNAVPQVFVVGPPDKSGYRPNVNVVVEAAGTASLEAWAEANRQRLEKKDPDKKRGQLENFEWIKDAQGQSEQPRELADGRKARVWTFRHSLVGHAVIQRQMAVLVGETAYIVTATSTPDSFAADEAKFETCLKSFRAGW
jgi:hypothetical protein